METRQPFEIAEEWIQKWSDPETTAIDTGLESVLDWELPCEQPTLCLAAILEVLRHIDRSKPSHLLSVLAAGPLENLLNYNGDAVVDEIDSLARTSPNSVYCSTGCGIAISSQVLLQGLLNTEITRGKAQLIFQKFKD